MTIVIRDLIAAAVLFLSAPAWCADVSVVALFGGKAVLSVDGGPNRTLSAGQTSPEGVRLISASSEGAVVEFGGRRETIQIGHGTRLAGGTSGSLRAQAALTADDRGHFVTTGRINGVEIRFLVDTGASTVAISGNEARRLGIAYREAPRTLIQTANGVVVSYRVRLDSISVGDITLHGVDAVVLDGDSLPIALLGMSFLNRLDMRREGGTLTLVRRQ